MASSPCALCNGIEHRPHVTRRAGNDAQDLADRGLLIERLLRLVEQADIVDGDRRLAGERLHQRDLVGREQTGLAPEKEDGPVGATFTHQRHCERGPNPQPQEGFSRIRVFGVDQRQHVGVVDGLALEGGATCYRRSP